MCYTPGAAAGMSGGILQTISRRLLHGGGQFNRGMFESINSRFAQVVKCAPRARSWDVEREATP